MSLTRPAAGVLLGALLALPASAQGTAFKHALPETCLFFATAPDFTASIREFKSTALFRMWEEDQVQEFLAELLKEAEKKKEEILEKGRAMHKAGQFPFDPDELLKLRLRSATLAVTTVELGMSDFGTPDLRFGALVHADFGDSAPSWRKVIRFGMDKLMEEKGHRLARTATKVEGVELVTMAPQGSSMSLNVAFVGTGVVIGSLKDEVETVIRNHITGKTVLTATDNYMETAKRLDIQGAELEAYLQPRLLVDTVMKMLRVAAEGPFFPPQVDVDGIDRAVTAFGLRSCRTLGATSQYQGRRCVTRAFAYSPEPERRGIGVVAGKSLNLDFLRWVPKDTANLSAGTFDAMALHDALVSAVKAYDEQQAEQLLMALESYEKQSGVTLKEDLFGVMGDHYIWWSMGVASFMQVPEWAILVKVKDEARLVKMLEHLAALSDGWVELNAAERRGVKTYRLEVNPEMLANEQMGMALSVVQPCFAFKSGYAVAALSSGDVRRAMKRMDREDDPKGDIRGNESFASYIDMIPKHNLSQIGWTNWRNSFENMYQAVTSILALTMPGDDVPIDLTLLPEAETLSQHLFGAMSWSVVDGTGYRTTMISPVGPELFALGAAGLGTAALGTYVVAGRGAAARPVVRARPARKKEEVEEEEAVESRPSKTDKKEQPKPGKKGDRQ